MGDFDQYLIDKFEEDWATELPEEFKPRRAQRCRAEEEMTGVEKASDDATGQIDDANDAAESLKRKPPGIGGRDGHKKAKGPDSEPAKLIDSSEDQVMSDGGQVAQSSPTAPGSSEKKDQKKTLRVMRNSLAQRQNHGMGVDDEDELA
jgi:hypothetical protein